MPKVNPEILRWARETAGLSVEEAAQKLALTDERLRAMEQGEKEPSRPQLVKMSEKYRRPLLTFYLPKPPTRSNRGEDFRTLRDARPPGAEALLDALLRDVHARHGLIRSALEEAEEADPVAWIDTARIADGVDRVVEAMRSVLNVSLEEFRDQNSAEDAFKVLRASAEQAGVFVLLMGNLGSHHTDIDVSVFRGFSLADPIAPFIVINEKDSRYAWSFTLLHELTHLWLGQTGVSGYDGEAEIERFCDSVAARFLLDPSELRSIADVDIANFQTLVDWIGDFAGDRNLSRKMVAYNLMRSGTISAATYNRLGQRFDADRRAQQIANQNGGGADYYVVRRHRVGTALISVVRRMLSGGELSTTKAGKVLGVKPTNVARLVESGQAA